MSLTEKQTRLIETLHPLGEVMAEMNSSDVFVWHVANKGMDKIPFYVKSRILLAIVKKGVPASMQNDMVAYQFIQAVKQDRRHGMELVANAIRIRDPLEYGEDFLCTEIGPLSEDEIGAIYRAYMSSGRRKDLAQLQAYHFLAKACRKDYLPLMNHLRGWIKNEHDFAIDLIKETARNLYGKDGADNEWKELSAIIKDDLAARKIAPGMPEKKFQSKHEYVEYLLSRYSMAERNKKKILGNLAKHSIIHDFLPALKSKFSNNEFEHPLSAIFDYEQDEEVVLRTVRNLMNSDFRARYASYSTIALWELEELLKWLPKSTPGGVKGRLMNPPQYDDTISELVTFRLLGRIGDVSVYPDKKIIDGQVEIDKKKINIEIAHPRLETDLNYGGFASLEPQSKADVIAEKVGQIKKVKDGDKIPFLLVLDGSSTVKLEDHVMNYLGGNLAFQWIRDQNTDNIVWEGWVRLAGTKGISDADRKLISAVIVTNRKITTTGVSYRANIIPIENAINPLQRETLEKIHGALNGDIVCPFFFKLTRPDSKPQNIMEKIKAKLRLLLRLILPTK